MNASHITIRRERRERRDGFREELGLERQTYFKEMSI